MKYNEDNCPFCNRDREVILQSEDGFVIYDKFPVNNGHVLIIPRRHCENFFELSQKEQRSCFELLQQAQQIIAKKYNPDGFNIGININEAAGQTVPHVHIHLIPRYTGDVPNPVGGVRGVIPERKEY